MRRIRRDSSSFFLFSYYNSAVGGVTGLLALVGGRDIATRPKLNSRLPAFRHSGLITHTATQRWLVADSYFYLSFRLVSFYIEALF